MNLIKIIVQKELTSFFSTSQAYIFLVAYLGFSSAFTFFLGNFFGANEATLNSFFGFQPWLFLFFLPAITMKMWADEHRLGTTEFLLTLPIDDKEIVIGKFIASWLIAILAISLTFPIWISVNILGSPDNGIVVASYLGTILLSGMFVAMGLAIPSITNSQVISFIITIAIAFLFLMSGTGFVLDGVYEILPILADFIASLSAMSHFYNFVDGVVNFSSLLYFVSTIIFWLSVNYFIILIKRG